MTTPKTATPAQLKRWVVSRFVNAAARELERALAALPEDGWSEILHASELARIREALMLLYELRELRKASHG